ncbi:MAG: HAMP domain-containing histidine kinase [Fibrobacterota bacterium]|nr:HAMP domain-containing histidine kinase [Fibrobacterota bacterium]
MMSVEKTTTALFYAALGAFAAYLGFWWSGNGNPSMVLSMAFALGMAVTGLSVVAKTKGSILRREPGSDPKFWAMRPSEVDRDGNAALLGHEMKNYLCTLKGSARLLRQRIQGRDRNIIDRIDRVVEKLESFTCTMGKAPDATGCALVWGVQMGDVARFCMKTHFHKNSHGFTWDIQADAPTLLGDPGRLEQVFLNLYANSLEAGAQQMHTTIRRDGNTLLVRVEDDGKGCARDDLGRIFTPFFTTKEGPARRGLGMFIVQSIVENHCGTIKARTKNGTAAGQGLIFTLSFPISIPAREEKPVFEQTHRESKIISWVQSLPEPF